MSAEAATKFPVSYQQEHAWRRHSNEGGRQATCWAEISGPLDVRKLRECLQRIVQRYEILRTTFAWQDSTLSQVVTNEPAFDWSYRDIRNESQFDRTAYLRDWVDRPVDFADCSNALPRVLLAAVADNSYVLLLSISSLCADALSMDRLVGLIADGYSGKFPNEEAVFQYGDFALWQHELLTQPETQAGREFWRAYARQLESEDCGHSWPAISVPANGIQSCAVNLDPLLIPRIEAFCSANKVSFSTVLLACWYVFLSRISQQHRRILTLNFDCRNYPEFHDAIGPFAKWIPVSLNAASSMVFSQFAGEVQQRLQELQSWQQSFCGLDENPATSRRTAEVGFNCVELRGLQRSGEVGFEILQASDGERFVLRLLALRQEKHVRLEFEFDTARLNQDVVDEWSESYLTLVAAAIRNPQLSLGRLPVLSIAQRERLLVEWNQTEVEYPRTQCIHELIEEQVARTPDRIAVRCMDRALTYCELNGQANQLAHWLRARGVSPDQRVGLCLDRSLGMMVGILGILKAGGAYVPLNPEHPPLRLAEQLCGAVALVTQETSRQQIADFDGATVCLDRDQSMLAALPSANLERQTTPENLAYVLFTSGSTGTPKGVAVRHRNLVNYTWFARGLLELDRISEGLQFALVSTLCADVGITCIFPALTSGGCLHVIPYEVATDSSRYSSYSNREKIDVLKIVPSHLAALLCDDDARMLLPKRFLVLGGERLTQDLMHRITAAGGGCEVINHYAPTETTCGSLTLRLSTFDWRSWQGASIPLGRPIANTRVYVLDGHGQPVPVGARGELYIAGDGVSAGYVGDQQRTAERFLPDPFVPGATMYRSGDVVRYLPDGNVEFIERADDQLKIRGFRVELGEVQALIERHSCVKQAIVLARAAENGDRRLLGWAVPKDGAALTEEELRQFVKLRLPEYMVPARMVLLPAFPLTRNGKIDRQQLPDPETATVSVAPQTAMEQAVASVWREVLQRDEIGREERFFEIGGHSLLATRIVARLRNRLKLSIPVALLFEHPTIAGMASEIERVRQELESVHLEEVVPAPTVCPTSRVGPVPLSFAQEALWVRQQFDPPNSLYNIPRAWRIKGTLDAAALQRSLDEIVRRHESQRTTFASREGRPLQIIANSLHIPIAQYDLTTLIAEEKDDAARRIVENETLRPFDLERGPLLRVGIVRLSQEDHILLIVFHHIISDAWSAGIFFSELKALYEAFSREMPSPLPPVSLQYADYAIREREWLQGPVLEKLVSYWRRQLEAAPPRIALPMDRQPLPGRSSRGSCETVRLSRRISDAVMQFSAAQNITPFTSLMAVFQALLWSYSGEAKIVVGTDVANRNTPEVEGIVGCFVNVLPICADFSGTPSFRQLVVQLRPALLNAYAHQQLPFSKIVEAIQPQRSNSENPVVQAVFVFQNASQIDKSLANLDVVSYPVPVTTSKNDLTVFIAQDADRLVGHWVYATDLFDRATIREMSRRFERLTELLISQPDVPLASFAACEQRCHAQSEPNSTSAQKTEAEGRSRNPTPERSDAANRKGSSTGMEAAVASVWCEVLQRAQIGIDDNLFEIGGHSLIATQIAARLRSRLGIAVYVRTIFDHPTIRTLAQAIDITETEPADSMDRQILQVPRVALNG